MNSHAEAITHLLAQADKTIHMAQDLADRGFHAEAVTFALIGAQYCQAIRALERLEAEERRSYGA